MFNGLIFDNNLGMDVKMKHLLFGLILVFLIAPGLYAIDVTDIEEVRLRTENSLSELQSSDRSLISEFWDNALNIMLISEDVHEIVQIRRQLEEQKGSKPLFFYASTYISAAREHLQQAFENVQRIEDAEKRQLLEQNLMILTAQLKSPELTEFALKRLDAKDSIIRYWAVKAVTNSGVIQILSSEGVTNDEAKEAILNGLKTRLVSERQPDILIMIIKYAAAMDHPTSHQILLAIADERIKSYVNWSVDNEVVDTKLLIAMGNMALIQEDTEVKKSFARKFAQLYSLIFQRYLSGREVLSDNQIDQVVTVILEVNQMILAKMLNVPKTSVPKAIQMNRGLEREYETIFGDRLRLGDLSTLYQFDYGKDASGKAVTEPPKLPAPPANLNATDSQ